MKEVKEKSAKFIVLIVFFPLIYYVLIVFSSFDKQNATLNTLEHKCASTEVQGREYLNKSYL